MRKALLVGVCIWAALAFAELSAGGIVVGVADDTGKYASDGGAWFYSEMNSVGLTENRISVLWDPLQPTTIVDQEFLDRSLPVAAEHGIRVTFSVYPARARAIASSPTARDEFVAFLQLLAHTYPQVKDFIVGNEPNQPRFWQPQFNRSRSGVAGAAYETLLAQSYDALKAVDPTIEVIGAALAPRGNDNPSARSNISTSPVRFLHDLGIAYRASGRAAPIMDELALHAYPNSARDPLMKGYRWPNAGVPNLARIKQAVWDAFHNTAQPTVEDGLTLRIAETGWQVGILSSARNAYRGQENVPTTDEATQARIYARMITFLACDPAVTSLLFFGLVDETDLTGFQAGLLRADGTRRGSYSTVSSAIAQTGGRCLGRRIGWRHTTSVVGAAVTFGNLSRSRPRQQRYWTFSATAAEAASYKAGIFPVALLGSPGPRDIARAMRDRAVPSGAILSAAGHVKAKRKHVVRFPARRLSPGFYVFAIRMRAAMNPNRTSVFVSKPFRVVLGKPPFGGLTR